MQAVLFDLDGTLLDLDVPAFLHRYFPALGAAAAPHFPGVDLLPAVLKSTEGMQQPHEGLTNREFFYRDFLERTGVDLQDDWDTFEAFYRDVFPTLGTGYGPTPGARDAILAARALGMKVAIATQPIFPRIAIDHRLAWAGLDDLTFDVVTTYEYMYACKPQAAFFTQVADMLGCDSRDCLMVGDDRSNDMPAAAVGMRTFYVGGDPDAPADFRGTLEALPHVLQRWAADAR